MKLDRTFDEFLYQLSKGLSVEQIKDGVQYIELERVKEWTSKFGFSFNIYSNEHFINGEPHFHLDHKEKGVKCKVNFIGEVLECKGNRIIEKSKLKYLRSFLDDPKVQAKLRLMWNTRNPELAV